MINLSNSTYYPSPFPHLIIDNFLSNPESLGELFWRSDFQPGFKASMSAEFDNLVNHINSSDLPSPTVDLSFDNDEFFWRSYHSTGSGYVREVDRLGPNKHYMLQFSVTASGEDIGSGGGITLFNSSSLETKEIPYKYNQAILMHCSKESFIGTKGYKGDLKEIHYPFVNTCSFAWGPQAPNMPQPC